MSTAAPIAGVESLQKTSLSIQYRVAELAVTNETEYAQAAELGSSITELLKEIASTFDPIVKKANEAHKEALAQKQRFYAPLESARRTVDRVMLDWKREAEQKQRIEEQRLAAEAKERADAAARAEAEALERAGEGAAAQQVREQAKAAPPPAVILPPAAPKVAGFATRKVHRWRVVDISKIPLEYLVPDELKINARVRSFKEQAGIPGIEVYVEDLAAHR